MDLKCTTCGKFIKRGTPIIQDMVYSGYPPQPDHDILTCDECNPCEHPSWTRINDEPDVGLIGYRQCDNCGATTPLQD